jgi:hypothetical protein
MSNESWILLGVHSVIFIIVRWRLSLKKKQLQREKADLTIQVTKLQGELNYYMRMLDQQDQNI